MRIHEGEELPRIIDIPAASPSEQAQYNRAVREGNLRRRLSVVFLQDVTFTDQRAGHLAGEVAGFSPEEAQNLVKAGLASYDLDAKPPKSRPPVMAANAAGDVAVRLLKPCGSLFAGEIAGFSDDAAHEMFVKGIGEPAEIITSGRSLQQIRRDLKDARHG